MNYKISEIEGIGPVRSATLAEADITTTEQLLEKCGAPTGRADVSKRTQISTALLLKWANMADLMRISGVGGEYAELLEAAGVDTVKELRTRRPDNLTAKMAEVNAEKMLVRALPTEANVADWVAQAGALTPMITH